MNLPISSPHKALYRALRKRTPRVALSFTRLRAAKLSLAFCLIGASVFSTGVIGQSVNSEDPVVQDLLKRLPDRAKVGSLGVLKIAVFPEAILNGETVILAPGTRIYSANNMIMLPVTLYDQAVAVVYRKDILGQVIEAWLVNRDEIAAIKKLQGIR
jgi:hypothetical protein